MGKGGDRFYSEDAFVFCKWELSFRIVRLEAQNGSQGKCVFDSGLFPQILSSAFICSLQLTCLKNHLYE